MHWSST